ncbi:MAG: RPA family protein [Halodesulfurarchaeum sp.]
MSGESPRREVAHRVFAHEFNASDFTYAESEEERAPNYLVTPTGARMNRLFVVGVLTEVEPVSDDVVRARIVDPTGAFVSYAGQYQSDALAFFERAEPPMFVALTGKARTFQPEGSDRVFTSIRPETVNEVDGSTRDRWVVQTAEHTLERIAVMGAALEREERGDDLSTLLADSDVRPALAAGVPRAIEHYGTTPTYLASLQDLAIDALRVVAGEIDEVERPSAEPDESGHTDLDPVYKDAISLQVSLPEERQEQTEPEQTEARRGSEDEAIDSGDAVTEAEGEVGELEEEKGEAADEPREAEDEIGDVDDEIGEAGDEIGRAEDEIGEAEEEMVEAEEGVEPAEATTDPEEVGEAKSGTHEAGEEGVTPEESPAEVETDEMYELSEEEREAVEESYDVGFESGAEMRESGEEMPTEGSDGDEEGTADAGEESSVSGAKPHETPSESAEESGAGEEGESNGEGDGEGKEDAEADAEAAIEEEVEPDSETETDEQEVEPDAVEAGSLEDAVVETMREMSSGDGVRRDELIQAVVERRDATEAAVEDAIESALLGGRCFESGEDHLKPI